MPFVPGTIVPTEEFPLTMPLTVQVTAVLVVSTTEAEITSEPPTFRPAYGGDTSTPTVIGTMVTVAEAETLESAWLVAVTVAVAGFGTLEGAL